MTRTTARLLGCLLAAATACTGQAPPSPSDGGFVHWIGLDSRPLAVGSQIVVTLEIATDAGSAPPYAVSSSNPDILTVLDAGDQRILLDVLGAGSATLELNAAGSKADLAVTTEMGVAVSLFDAQRYAAGIRVALDPKFALDLLADSQEVLQGVVLDANCEPLNSWGLIQAGNSLAGQLSVSPRPPEQFVIASGNTLTGASLKFGLTFLDAGVPGSDADSGADFDGGFREGACDGDAGSSVNLSNLSVVSAAASVGLISAASDGLVVAAKAYANDGTEVFGIDDWEFSCAPAATCVVMPFSPSVVGVSIPSNSGAHAVTVSSPSQGLTLKPPLTIQ